eukprot:gene12151-13404_t
MEESCKSTTDLGHQQQVNVGNMNSTMLPRPCSMPNFDKKLECTERKLMQTLPVKSCSRRSLNFKPWKSMTASCGSFMTSPTFGTPSYPAYLDTIRAKSACLSTANVASHPDEVNNNKLYPAKYNYDDDDDDDCSSDDVAADKFAFDKNLAESQHSFSYSASFSRGTFTNNPAPGLSSSLNASWQFFNFIGGADSAVVLPTTTRNPNKALLTIDARTSKILVANETACKLFGYQSEDLTGMNLSTLFAIKDSIKHNALLEQHIDTEGNIVMVSGKVIEAVDSSGNVIAVSLWMKRFQSDDDQRCIVIIEPIQRSVASILFNAEGTIVDCDSQFAYLHGYTSPEEVVGLLIQNLIPAIMLPIPGHEIKKHVKKQRATGKARNNSRFPVSIKISEYDKESHELYLRRGHTDEIQFSKFLYKGILWVFSNISGLVSVLPDGQIHSCNSNFSLMLFGCSEEELVGKNVTSLIPAFYDQMDLAEDRSFRIPSFSEDEVQLDPNRGQTSSGKFTFESSSQSDFDSDVDLYCCEAKQQVASAIEIECDLDSSANSTATLGSSIPNTSDLGNNAKVFVKTSSPIKDDLFQSSCQKEAALVPGGCSGMKSNASSGFCDMERLTSPIKLPQFSSHLDVDSSDSLAEHSRQGSDSSYVSVTTLKSDSSGCTEVADKNGDTTSSCVKGFTEGSSKMPSNEGFSSCAECDEADGEKSPIIKGENVDLVGGKYDRKKLEMVSSVSDDEKLEENEDLSVVKSSGSCQAVDGGCEERRVFNDLNDKFEVVLEMDKTKAKPDKEERVEGVTEDVSEKYGGSHGNELHLSRDNMQGNVEEKQETAGNDAVGNSSQQHDKGSLHEHQRGNAFVAGDGSVVVDDGNEAVSESLSPCKRVNGHGARHDDCDIVDSAEEGKNNDSSIKQQDQFTSTPKLDRGESQHKKIYEGSFYGQAKHKDESLLPIVFQVKQIALNRGKELFCVWISRDAEDQDENYRIASQMMLTGSFNSTLNTSLGNFADVMKSHNDLSISYNEDSVTFKGKYDEKYMTLKSIGKGAFGFVKLAQRRSDSLEVVVKFIQKSKIIPANWIDDQMLGKVPLEIAFLAKLEHENIVRMHEVFENDEFFQLVMEKHGEGIDLFEFIDRQPALDEPLCSYMFRQILSAVSYLHSKNILHRDVKDENIIIDRSFTLKLIDFGSAVFMEKNKLFSTFCGTVEYCSPEVLLGNQYNGPELEVWSLGITLYTVVFGENPFFDVEETIKAELRPPFKVSAELMFLVCWMLHPEPDLRATVKDIEKYRWVNQKVDITQYNYDAIFYDDSRENTDQDDHSVDYDNNEYDDEDIEDYAKENELLEGEYMKYLNRQQSIPDHSEGKEHGGSF